LEILPSPSTCKSFERAEPGNFGTGDSGKAEPDGTGFANMLSRRFIFTARVDLVFACFCLFLLVFAGFCSARAGELNGSRDRSMAAR